MKWQQKEPQWSVSFSCISHQRFKRPQNQDFYGKFLRENLTPKGQLFVVANGGNDSIESRKAGEMAVNIIQHVYYSDPSEDVSASLRQAFEDANTLIHELFNDDEHKDSPGVSCTALVLTKDRVYIAHVGDNRAYRISYHKIERLTNGKTQQVILTKKEPEIQPLRSKLSRALGEESSVNIYISNGIPLQSGNYYLLCNEGLANVDDNLIKYVILSNSPQQACKKLIYLAEELGCKHDIHVQVIGINPVPISPIWTKPMDIKIASMNKLYWLFGALLLLLTIAAIDKFRGNSPNQTITQSKSNHSQKESLLINQEVSEDFKEPEESIRPKGNYEQVLNIHVKDVPSQPNKNESEFLRSENEKRLSTRTSSNRIFTSQNRVDSDKLTLNRLKNKDAIFSKIDIIKGIHPDAWDFAQLAKEDLELRDDKIIFLASPRKKKALYNLELANLSFQVQAQVLNDNFSSRYGIIVGYKVMKKTPFESYYLFSMFENKQLLLQRISNFKKELIASFPIELESIKDRPIRLKVICQGPKIILYANQRRLYAWKGDDNIEGRVGLYADPDLQVEYSKIEIFKATDVNE